MWPLPISSSSSPPPRRPIWPADFNGIVASSRFLSTSSILMTKKNKMNNTCLNKQKHRHNMYLLLFDSSKSKHTHTHNTHKRRKQNNNNKLLEEETITLWRKLWRSPKCFVVANRSEFDCRLKTVRVSLSQRFSLSGGGVYYSAGVHGKRSKVKAVDPLRCTLLALQDSLFTSFFFCLQWHKLSRIRTCFPLVLLREKNFDGTFFFFPLFFQSRGESIYSLTRL